jgi:hypothetical protein
MATNGLTASDTFPELWSSKVQRNADAKMTIAPLVTRRYEGELKKKGDIVHVTQWPDLYAEDSSVAGVITVPTTYTRRTAIAATNSTASTRNLTVKQEKALREAVDDVDDAQSMFNLINGLGPRYAYAFARAIEVYLWSYAGWSGGELTGNANTIYSGLAGASGNYGKTSAAFNALASGATYDWCVDIDADLDTRNAADGRRVVVVPPIFAGALRKESELTGISTEGTAKEVVVGGMVARAGGLDIIKSTIMTKGTHWAKTLEENSSGTLTATTGASSASTWHVFGGVLGEAVAFVKQINKVFPRDAVDAPYVNLNQICVYGGMTLDPSSIFDAIIN